jgi:hypothetical protein
LGENIYRSRRAVNWLLIGRRGIGRCVDEWVWTETAKGEKRICKEKSVRVLSVWVYFLIIIISFFVSICSTFIWSRCSIV